MCSFACPAFCLNAYKLIICLSLAFFDEASVACRSVLLRSLSFRLFIRFRRGDFRPALGGSSYCFWGYLFVFSCVTIDECSFLEIFIAWKTSSHFVCKF